MGKLSATVFETDTVQPNEEFAFTVDFFSRLITGELISTVAVSIFSKDGTDVTGTVRNGAGVIQTGRSTSSEILVNVHGLVDGERYNVQILATTSAGTPQVLEGDVYIPVKKIAKTA